MGTTTNVRVGYSGALYTGALGTTFPTDPVTAWGTGWADVGFISDDGVSLSADMEIQEFKAWGFPTAPVRTQVTNEEFQFTVALVETNAYTLSLWEGVPLADITSTAAVTGPPAVPQFLTITKGVADEPDIRAFGLDVIDGTKYIRRMIPRGQVVDRGEVTYKTDELVSYSLTIRALLSSSNVAMTTFVSDVALPA
jgi:hypothetical protein